MSLNNHLSFSKSYMLSVHEAIKILFSYHLPCQGSRNCQKSDVSNHSFVDMVRSPILPIHIANLSRLSKCTLPITSIPKPLKLSNSQISYPIWQMSILMFAWRVGDNQVELRSDVFLNSYGGWHAITLQWCFHSIKWVLFRIAMYRPSGYNRIFCVAVSTELRCFEMPKPAGRQCSVLGMRLNPGWSTS